MLQIEVPNAEYLNEVNNEFVQVKGGILQLEHSLISLSKWESTWEKPFLNKGPETEEEAVDYVKCMTLNNNVDSRIYFNLTEDNLNDINHYIDAPMTATWFNDRDAKLNREVITAEIIYYWMIALNIPFECQKWHINRLLTLIKVCNIKNGPKKKMNKKDIMAQNRALNAARKRKHNSKG